ncbi:hypothetical protein KEM55_004612, partial [Ascosphaera atra]
LVGSESLQEVVVSIPFSSEEPSITSHDAMYEVGGDGLEWHIGNVDESNSSGSFEFEVSDVVDENEYFPMSVHFVKTTPFVDVDVLNVASLEAGGEPVSFAKDAKTVADNFLVE